MYTRCPHCKTAYRITPEQIREGRGKAFCHRCKSVFNAASGLSGSIRGANSSLGAQQVHTPVLSDREAVIVPNFEREHWSEYDAAAWAEAAAARRWAPGRDSRFPWGLGAGLLLLALLSQTLYFERSRIVQNVHLRPALESLCSALHCRLPPFREVAAIRIVDRSLRITPDRSGYEFRMILANEAAFEQPFPTLRLTLDEIGGRSLAERIFQPSEYLPSDLAMSPMPVGQPVEIDLLLARPAGEVGGFSFDLL